MVMDPAYDKSDAIQTLNIQLKKFSIPYLKIFQRLLFTQKRKDRLDKAQMIDKINALIEQIDIIREKLDLDSQHRPLKLLGFTASHDLLNQIYTTILTVGLAMAQQYFSTQEA